MKSEKRGRRAVEVRVDAALVFLGLATSVRAARKAIGEGRVRVASEPFRQWDGSVSLTRNTRFFVDNRSKTFEVAP